MIELRPCPSCRRHVALVEAACPFCAAPLATATARPVPRGRLSRAAVFAAGALAATACGGKAKDQPPASHDVAPALPADAKAAVAAPADAALADAAIDAPVDAAIDAGVDPAILKKQRDAAEQREKQRQIDRRRVINAKPYGAPPARRRIV